MARVGPGAAEAGYGRRALRERLPAPWLHDKGGPAVRLRWPKQVREFPWTVLLREWALC